MNSIRFKFARGEEVKFISHLDIVKVFQRALRRADIPVAYSQGFNPHPQMVFGLPLPVGVTSEAEYADFELSGFISAGDFIKVLNGVLPKGIFVLDAKYKETKTNIMASVARASYCVLVSCGKEVGINFIREAVDKFRAMPEITVKKENKSGIRELNIKPMIFELEILELPGQFEPVSKMCTNRAVLEYAGSGLDCSRKGRLLCISAVLSAGSEANLKPELLISALNEISDLRIKVLKIHRTGLYVKKGGEVCDPLDDNVLNAV